MANEKELLEIRKEINSYKDQIKNSSQKILFEFDNPKDKSIIDTEMLEILNALGKIGTISGNSKNVSSYSKSISDFISTLKQLSGSKMDMRSGYQWCLNLLCSSSFEVIQKGKKYEIKIPTKIDFNFFKVG